MRRFRAGTCGPAVARFDQGLFFFNDTATTEIYTLSLHDALPDLNVRRRLQQRLDLVDALLRRVLRFLFLFAMRAVSARHLVCLRVQQVRSGFFTPAALAMHGFSTEEPEPEVRAGAPIACLSAAR